MDNHVILGVHVTDRVHKATNVQQLFTEYGCSIKTRLGLHEVNDKVCSPRGLIILEMFGPESDADALAGKLNAIDGIECKKMVFTHDES